MFSLKSILISITLIVSGNCQYNNNNNNNQEDSEQYPRRPPPQILTHKQALNHDGNFKYLFTSENGLAQGESIAPDGSRTGGYSYVDPNGKKISVKYTAGKEGFKILEADHLPKAPQPIAPIPQPQPQAAYSQPQGQYDDGQYRPQTYEKQQQQGPPKSYYQPKGAYTQAAPSKPVYQPQPSYPAQYQARAASLDNDLNEKEGQYNDAPGKPYSFGSGYLFEFGSG